MKYHELLLPALLASCSGDNDATEHGCSKEARQISEELKTASRQTEFFSKDCERAVGHFLSADEKLNAVTNICVSESSIPILGQRIELVRQELIDAGCITQ